MSRQLFADLAAPVHPCTLGIYASCMAERPNEVAKDQAEGQGENRRLERIGRTPKPDFSAKQGLRSDKA
ncbi:hypothetical protein GCM10025772_15970 [Ferrimonas gelatinilytica]|uniref:Uncharacterized protein n=1 Tax=Ferrimonas gelatinilytica TaxID=1255257 RepID=A0ABP9S5A3_9GAMM